ncbi:hypothetical protein TNCV_4525701 [Trichonephila clavipes]|nr:hypothetical protein TNCV_4525701 [Trichonephila clavipes]
MGTLSVLWKTLKHSSDRRRYLKQHYRNSRVNKRMYVPIHLYEAIFSRTAERRNGAKDDSELADQDLWAHLPQDNIRCLINSVPDRVAACIAAGGGPTRY